MNDIDIEIIDLGSKVKENPKESREIVINQEDLEEDRYHRLKLIPWWDQEKLKKAKILVVGAGALGNELIKNLALLGVGNIYIIDFDLIENSNLSRSVLFRSGDEGKKKSEMAAKRAMEINPDINAKYYHGNIVYDVGLGFFRHMDIVLGGLDNREARLGINQSCWKVTRPWIDGAIEVLHGVARVFIPPDSACYECTMNEQDYKILNMRKSCALLSREEMLQGKTPTTPTVSSIIAGIQIQEALKIIHNRNNLQPLRGKGFFYNGYSFDSYIVDYERKEDCLSHETYENIVSIDKSIRNTTVKEALDIVRKELNNNEAILEFDKEIISSFICNKCNEQENVFISLGKATEKEAKCKKCGEMRNTELTHSVTGTENYLDKTLYEIGIPLWEILTGRHGMEMVHIEFSGDKEEMLNCSYGDR